ncbi:MAG: hypothetical protein WA580_09405 [Acidimicrobiales bacterium]
MSEKPTDVSCGPTPVLSREHLLGINSVGANFSFRGGWALAFEYLAHRRSVVDAFERADTIIYTFGSCSSSVNGVVTDAAANEGTIQTRTFGTWSDADRYSYDVRGVKYQLGYMVVRDQDFLLIVGFANRGALKLKTLEGLTEKALAKLSVE